MSVLDYHLQHVLFKILDKQPQEVRHQLRNISRCGRRTIPAGVGTPSMVAVLRSNTGDSALFGQQHCRNPHACPVCSAKIMEVYRAKIASALDEEYARGYYGFMATFTVPHLWFMSCRETTDILYETWRYFRQKIKSSHKNSTWVHPYREFCNETGTDSWVRVCEYTFSFKNGWHPHFHCIFWTPKAKFNNVLEWEQRLCNFWIEQAKRVTLKYWRENNLHTEMGDLNVLLNRVFAHQHDWNQSLRFSRDNKGKLLRATSSEYLTGWGSDREATGNYRKKASHEGHFTPYQILEKAEHDPRWAKKYVEFCMAVTQKPVHHRMNFSKNGIYKRVENWQAVNGYVTVGEVKAKKKSWAVVAYFDSDAWYAISSVNRKIPVISNILYLAAKGRHLLIEYISSLKIPIHLPEDDTEFSSGFRTRDVIERIFNNVA